MHKQPSKLEAWYKAFHDYHILFGLPECFRSERPPAADELLAEGLISEEQRFEMGELILAAYSFAIETTLSHRYCGSAEYEVLQADTCAIYASLKRGRLLVRDSPTVLDRRVGYNAQGNLLMLNGEKLDGHIEGLRWTDASGQAYDLVEMGRCGYGGTYYETIYDPITYRLLLDCLQLAIDTGNQALISQFRHRLAAAAYVPCPVCHDAFAQREGCISCNGQGFVRR